MAQTEESMQVVAMLQFSDVVGQQPPTHVPLIVVKRQESVTAQAYGYAIIYQRTVQQADIVASTSSLPELPSR